jgi:excinuclease ABC subunit C
VTPRRSSPVPDWVPEDLPKRPGVYQFEDAHGTLLYVGKSVNLHRRVRGYFYGGGPRDERMAQMVRLARRVRVRPTGTDLEARLEEAERIVAGRPRFNRALKNRSNGWFVEIDWSRPYPRLRVVRSARKPGARYFGPFRGRRLPSEMAELTRKLFRLRACKGPLRPDPRGSPCAQLGIGLCTAPCIGESGLNGYRSQVRDAERTLADPGHARTVRARLLAEREARAAKLDFEGAADAQRRLGWLDELELLRGASERPWLDRSWLIALPHARPELCVLVPVARGRVLARIEARRGDADRLREAVMDACYAVRVAELRAEPVFPPRELVPSLIVSRWLAEGAPEGTAVDLDRAGPEDALATLTAG